MFEPRKHWSQTTSKEMRKSDHARMERWDNQREYKQRDSVRRGNITRADSTADDMKLDWTNTSRS